MTARIKKIVLLAISVLLLFSLVTPVFAATQNTGTEDVTMNKTVASIIKNQLTDEEWSDLRNTRKYDKSMRGKRISDQVVLKVYPPCWDEIGKSLPEIIAAEEKNLQNYHSYSAIYVVFDKNTYFVKVGYEDKKVKMVYNESSVPNCVKDILILQDHFRIAGEECTLKGVYCFNMEVSDDGFFGVLVYLDTDKGVFVRYYETPSSEGVLYSNEDFTPKALAYFDSIIYHEGDELKLGQTDRFGEYLRKNEIELKQLALEQDEPAPAPKTNWVVPAVAGAVIVCGTAALLLIRHKRRKPTAQTEEPEKAE